MESHSSTTMTPHGLIRALHTEIFRWNKIRAHVKSDILQNFQIQKLHRSNRLVFRFVKYSLWCLIYCADEEALHEKWHFFVVDFCVDYFGTINSHTIPLFFLFSRCQLLLCMSKKETIRSIAYIFWIEF